MSRPIVVLHVLDDLETGGTEKQLSAFILRSSRSRFHHEVCVLSEGGRFAVQLEETGIPIHVTGVAPSGDLLRSVLRLWHVVRKVDPDIVHATLYRPGVVSRIVGFLCRKPTVTTLVNTTYEPEWFLDNPRLNRVKVWMAHALDRLTSKWLGTKFVAVSESIKASAIRQLGISPERIVVIRRGLLTDDHATSTPDAVAAVRADLGVNGAYPLILNVGRLVPQKGQRYAILAMRDIIREYPTARLIIAGEGPLKQDLERLIRSQALDAHVTLLGDRKDVGVLLQLADLFVFPSLYEGAANALVEAMAAARPCVASRIPSLCELTGDGAVALLADLRSPADLASHLRRLAGAPETAERLGRESRARVHAGYNIEESVRAFESLFEQLAPAGPMMVGAAPVPTSPDTSVAAVILTYNRRDLLRQCLRGIQTQTRPIQEIIVVDNASHDGTPEMLRAEFPTVIHLRMSENLGCAGGFAAGLDFAFRRGHAWLWCFDDDCRPAADDCLTTLLQFAGSCQDVAFVRPMLRNPYKEGMVGGGMWSGSLLAVRAVEACGIPNKDLFTEFEDHEYSRRLKAKGFRVFRCEQTAVWHPHEFNTLRSLLRKGSVVPPWRLYYQVRNPVYVQLQNMRLLGIVRILLWAGRWFLIASFFGPTRLLRIRMILKGLQDGIGRKLGARITPPPVVP